MRLVLLTGTVILAFMLAVWSAQVPEPRGQDATPEQFSTHRAMQDVRIIARAPHPVGTADHARVQAYLLQRMTELGLSPTTQSGPLSPRALQRLQKSGLLTDETTPQAVNLIGRLPGKDGTQPAVLIMAHYDTVAGSPGAADDTTGVAAILETVRAIRSRGPAERDLIVLLTDAEELNLDGARLFFSEHPWRDSIGTVVNLEARGGGGRAAMFETGKGNGQTIPLFHQAIGSADGGTTSTSLAVFMYERMPNGTDFTIPKDRGIAGVNLAFIGRPAQYHTADATPDNLDQGAVQHLGSQALETADVLLRTEQLPGTSPNLVYADLFGRFLLSHPAGFGWILIGLTLVLTGLSFWRVQKTNKLGLRPLLLGMVDGVWFLAASLVLSQGVRLFAGPMSSNTSSSDLYYILLNRLPWMEAAATLAILALGLVLLSGGRHKWPRMVSGLSLITTAMVLVLGGFSPFILVAGLVATGLSLWPIRRVPSLWGCWLGLILLIAVGGAVLQALAPEAALILTWPALFAALLAAITAFTRPDLSEVRALILPAVGALVAGAWLIGLGHLVFLGIGMDTPGALGLIGLLVLVFLRPLSPPPGQMRKVMICAGLCLALACGLNLSARLIVPQANIVTALP